MKAKHSSLFVVTRNAPVQLGSVSVYFSRNELVVNGQVRRLQPKVMAVLGVLIEARGEVVTKSALLDSVWPNMAISDSVLIDAIYRLRQVLGDDPRRPVHIQTIHRRGYRIVAKLARISEPATAHCHHLERPYIAVTRLKSLGLDREGRELRNGLIEELIHRLGQNPGMNVLGTVFSIKNSTPGMHPSSPVSRLGLTHLVGGSIRSQSGHVRLITSLVDTWSGMQIWSDIYDGDFADPQAIQAKIARAITQKVLTRLAF